MSSDEHKPQTADKYTRIDETLLDIRDLIHELTEQGQVTDLPSNKIVVRRGTNSDSGDFDIYQHNLAGGDWAIPDSVDRIDDPVEVGGASMISLAVNSQSGNTFEVKVQHLDESFNVLYEDNATKDADLSGTDVRVDVSTASDFLKIVVTDTSGASENIVNGTLNIK